MKALLLKSTAIAVGLTAAFWLLSVYSGTFDRSWVVYRIRGVLFRLLVLMGMNPHQPSDAGALTLLFCLLALGTAAVLSLVEYLQTRSR